MPAYYQWEITVDSEGRSAGFSFLWNVIQKGKRFQEHGKLSKLAIDFWFYFCYDIYTV